MANTKIDEYQVMYSANAFVPRIWLKSNNQFIAQLTFKPNGSPLPPDGIYGGSVNLYYHLDDFENVIDLLRNEKPTYLSYNGSGGQFENGIMTTAEPVGEGET
jgi:hypothetical protein